MSRLHQAKKEYDQAISCLRRVLRIDSGHVRALSQLGDVYRSLGKYDTAVYYHRKAVLREPYDHRYASVAYDYLRDKEYGRAETYFDEAIRVNPGNAWNYYNKACLYSVQGNTEAGLHWLERAFDQGFSDWEHLKNDADSRALRETKPFKRLLKRYRKRR